MQKLALIGLLAGEAASLVITPPSVATAPVVATEYRSVAAAAPVLSAPTLDGLLFPPTSSMLIADSNGSDGEKLSPAKAKILAAKQAAEAKAAQGGYKPPSVITTLNINIEVADSSNKDPYKAANELREKIIDLESAGKLSKSKSAQLNQMKSMEAIARDKANTEVLRAKEKAAREVARADALSSDKTDGSFGAQFSKVTGLGF